MVQRQRNSPLYNTHPIHFSWPTHNGMCYSYRAVYAYEPQHDDELQLVEDDIVFVVKKCDDGWFIGRWRNCWLLLLLSF